MGASAAHSITAALGGRWNGQAGIARCPAHDDHSPSLSIRDGDEAGRVLLTCFAGCDRRDVLLELKRQGLLGDDHHRFHARAGAAPRRTSTPTPLSDRRSKLDYLLSKLRPIEGTLVETYLRSRDLELPPGGHHLRFLRAKPPRFTWPCMVGIITDFADASRILSLHFTRLRSDGLGKAPLPKSEQRSYLAGFAKQGGVIRLCDDADVTRRIGVAEGIETSLSVTTAFCRDEGRFEPVWAALDAGNLGGLPHVPGIETLVIYADRGPAGEQNADKLAQRWLGAECEVFISIAPVDDWNPAAVPS
jgi:putative DNA primase/helicase